ncbi:MAG TPA: YciI family protein [Gemmatimonadaceae bacterium]
MRVMVIVKATVDSENESSPAEFMEEMFEQMNKYNEELVKAGIMLAADGLKPSRFGKRVHFNGTKRTVTDGPFTETKELVAGFWLWQVRSMEEAIEWAKRCPNPMAGPSDLEIRPLYEAEDFPPEIAAKENALRQQVAKGSR